ncbi:hypothetical protein M747DRAFT_61885 [Aspergillus niger ATCC 13496]|uniref:Secreted peptide n=1 Tax=Aspergillus niger ATCC 13496 TaxID=1353008 RepID=A0A370BV01_ASPNG|nr:hypothetical protein M747DRAFT_61885 [Aspergillus niger ATCC 13496]
MLYLLLLLFVHFCDLASSSLFLSFLLCVCSFFRIPIITARIDLINAPKPGIHRHAFALTHCR